VPTSAWLKRVKNKNEAVYYFLAEPNSTRSERQAAIRVGPVSMNVTQAPGRVAPIAAAPSRVEFTLGPKGASKQTITAWSEQPGVQFAATTDTPWIKVTPTGNAEKAGARKFNIELAPAALTPGLHQGSVEITSPGTVNAPIRIPVVVTVAAKRP
jgi:hypothetical protein